MLVTVSGIIIDNKLLQLLNKLSLMFVIMFDKLIDFKFEHPKNALFPILVTAFGMIKDVKSEHPKNALFPIRVTLLDILIDVICVIEIPNILIPKSNTNCGIVISNKFIQLENIVVPI
jgi:hypothetical protein